MRWFRDIPGVLKLLLVGVLALVLLILLSPLALAAAVAALGVSVVAVIARAFRGLPVGRWGLVAASSLALALLFGGVSAATYGGWAGTGGGSSAGGTDRSDPASSSGGGAGVGDGSLCDMLRDDRSRYVESMEGIQEATVTRAETLADAAYLHPYPGLGEQELSLAQLSIDLARKDEEYLQEAADEECVPSGYGTYHGYVLAAAEETAEMADEVEGLLEAGDVTAKASAEQRLDNVYGASEAADYALYELQ